MSRAAIAEALDFFKAQGFDNSDSIALVRGTMRAETLGWTWRIRDDGAGTLCVVVVDKEGREVTSLGGLVSPLVGYDPYLDVIAAQLILEALAAVDAAKVSL